jgi:hypothetical protein
MGQFLVELQVPTDGSMRFEQMGQDPHHFTLWAEPEVLMELVQAVERV